MIASVFLETLKQTWKQMVYWGGSDWRRWRS